MEIDKYSFVDIVLKNYIALTENEILSRPNDLELGKYVREKLDKKKYENNLKKIKKDS